MSDSNQKEEMREPTNGKGEESPPEGSENKAPVKVVLSAAMRWLAPYFGMPLVVQTVHPIWRIRPGSAMILKDANGKQGVIGSSVPQVDKSGEQIAHDFFDRVILQPTACGTRVQMFEEVNMGKEDGIGASVYIVAPEEICCLSRVYPSAEQVEREEERVKDGNIIIPGAPGNQPGKIVT